MNCVYKEWHRKRNRFRSEGCSTAGDPYAKQFAGDKDLLMALGYWYAQINAQVGDLIRVTFTSPTDVVLEKI